MNLREEGNETASKLLKEATMTTPWKEEGSLPSGENTP